MARAGQLADGEAELRRQPPDGLMPRRRGLLPHGEHDGADCAQGRRGGLERAEHRQVPGDGTRVVRRFGSRPGRAVERRGEPRDSPGLVGGADSIQQARVQRPHGRLMQHGRGHRHSGGGQGQPQRRTAADTGDDRAGAHLAQRGDLGGEVPAARAVGTGHVERAQQRDNTPPHPAGGRRPVDQHDAHGHRQPLPLPGNDAITGTSAPLGAGAPTTAMAGGHFDWICLAVPVISH
jgi:hypothetical protein